MIDLIIPWNSPVLARSMLCVLSTVLFSLEASPCKAQENSAPSPEKAPATASQQLPVNWLYGAYLPKEIPLEPLSNEMRWKLFVRQSFTTPGIYIKTGFFAAQDTVANVPPEWGQSAEGFGKRLGSRYAQFLIQNSFTSTGDAIVKWEPRYDRCQCAGAWPRTRHAFIRNFVTYTSSEKDLRPQVFLYAAAYGGATLSAMWQPGNPNIVVKGYQGAIAQAWTGVLSHLIAEFAPDVERALHHHKEQPDTGTGQHP